VRGDHQESALASRPRRGCDDNDHHHHDYDNDNYYYDDDSDKRLSQFSPSKRRKTMCSSG
jgi:hypothetical protein